MSVSLQLLRVLPRNLLSWCFGRLAMLRLPAALNARLLGWYAHRYGVRLDEAAHPLESYRSLSEFFVRELRPGMRPVGPGIVSPVDGVISELGVIEDGRLIQAKGKDYSLDDLLQDPDQSPRFRGGFFLTLYLAPGDYHHIHSPVSGEISGFRAVPGTLWPVNTESVRQIPKLFCQNERVISFIESRDFGTVAVVKVGATNVGSIALAYDSFVANRISDFAGLAVFSGIFDSSGRPRQNRFRKDFREKIPIARGERLATFRLGSTVILVFEPGRFQPGAGCRAGKVCYGQQLNATTEA